MTDIQDRNWDAIIIGSGISSLTSAILLGKAGKKVCVLEKHSKIGGYMHCFNRFGQSYDTGSHYVGSLNPGESFHTLLSYLNVLDKDHFTPLGPHKFDIFQFPSFEASFSQGYAQTIDALNKLFYKEKKGITGYFNLIKKAVNEFPTYNFKENFDQNVLEKFLSISLKEVVESLISNEKLKCVLYAYCALHNVRPEDVPFGFHAIVTDSLITSPYGFKNGGDPFVNNFKKQIETLGGQIYSNAEVKKLEVKNKKITNVILKNGQSLTADWIISGTHPKITFSLIGHDNLTTAFYERLNNIGESDSFFAIYGITKNIQNFAKNSNYYFFKSETPSKFLDYYEYDQDPSVLFLSQPNKNYDPNSSQLSKLKDKFFPITIHGPGNHRWFSKWEKSKFGKRPEEYKIRKKEIAEKYLDYMEKQYPQYCPKLTKYETSSSLTNIHYNGSLEGSSYGIYHNIKNTGARSLGPRTHFKNLLLTGQSTLFPGLLASAIAGLRTVGHILGTKSIIKELVAHRSSFSKNSPLKSASNF